MIANYKKKKLKEVKVYLPSYLGEVTETVEELAEEGFDVVSGSQGGISFYNSVLLMHHQIGGDEVVVIEGFNQYIINRHVFEFLFEYDD